MSSATPAASPPRRSASATARWFPVLEGNATVVYRAETDLAGRQSGPLDYAAEENAAYASLDEQNTAYLKANGIATAHP